MKYFFAIALVQLTLVFGASANLSASHGVGNGGDFVRAHFIKKGTQIRNFLANTPKGREFSSEFNIRVYSFDSVLNTRVIVLSEIQLYDNFNQPVDAIFDNGQIHLYVEGWRHYLTSDPEIYMMIFHEMLRATNHYDDDFIISKHLQLEVSDEEIEEQPDMPLTSLSCRCSFMGSSLYWLRCSNQNKAQSEPAEIMESFQSKSACEMGKIKTLEENGQDSGATRINIDRYDINATHRGKKRDFLLHATNSNASLGFDRLRFWSEPLLIFPSGAKQVLAIYQGEELDRSISFIDLGKSLNLVILDGTYIGFEVID